MKQIRPEHLEYELKRWMRPDAHRFIRADWRRHVNPGSALATLFERYERKYRHDQPRVPAGSREGGRWTDDDAQSGSRFSDGLIRLAQADTGVISDAFGEPYYRPGGHHEAARAVYTKWNLKPETKSVFDKATTGTVPTMQLRFAPDGTPQGHFWGEAHFQYNEAIKELGEKFLDRYNITPEQMTPDQAREMLKEIRESKDPRIRKYNDTIRLIRRIYRLRTGRE